MKKAEERRRGMSNSRGNDVRRSLLKELNERQQQAVEAKERRTLIIAGAGSGKTEVMARRIAMWVRVQKVPKDSIVAFTFTDRAAEEMKFRIRKHIQAVTPDGEDATLGGMYVGTIHSFCLKMLRELCPDRYHNVDIIDESARYALIQRGYYTILGLQALQKALNKGTFATMEIFARAYDLLNEYNRLDVELPSADPPHKLEEEADWCKQAKLKTQIGDDDQARAFAAAAARFYAYLLCRRFLDFSTSQAELVRLLQNRPAVLEKLRSVKTHIVVDEVQDINPVQADLLDLLVGERGVLTAVGDHRQAIYRFRGGKVEIMSKLATAVQNDRDGGVYELTRNYRSTPRIISVANSWAETISPLSGIPTPPMEQGNKRRNDVDSTHVAVLSFKRREDEAEWIAATIQKLVNSSSGKGAYHDTRNGERGLVYSDIALLLRSSTDAALYMKTLERKGIPAVFRAGPDLFAQPEILLFMGAFGWAVGLKQFRGNPQRRGLLHHINNVLKCEPTPNEVIRAAARVLAAAGLLTDPEKAASRLIHAADMIHKRLLGERISETELKSIKTAAMRKWLAQHDKPRRVFPQALYHWLLAETDVFKWEHAGPRGQSAMFHLGQLSSLVKAIEIPGWNDPDDFKRQIIALYMWGAGNAKTNEAPLLVPPDAVTISTVHSAKGLEFAAVFLADVCANRFPSNRARTKPELPFSGGFETIRPSDLADNENLDDERRLMYVALTRAERYLFVTRSGRRCSKFLKEVSKIIHEKGGTVKQSGAAVPMNLKLRPSAQSREKIRLITSFSDIRYYLECPHDFYLRKVLGFAPTIDQAFGYGRGVHNLMRAVHSNPKRWVKLAGNREQLEAEIKRLIQRGLFYLRYTTGEPRRNMENKAVAVIADYVERYAEELERLRFEPEREFEILLEEEEVLISGAIDVIRLDNPPRVTLIDFKSGHPESAAATALDEDEMKLQVSLYGLAAKRELEYEPDRGLVRYLGAETAQELEVPLDQNALRNARRTIGEIVERIRRRKFFTGPTRGPRDPSKETRCAECDFRGFCGMKAAQAHRKKSGARKRTGRRRR